MDKEIENLHGMDVQEAREYLLRHLTTLKEYTKQIQQIEQDCAKWQNRVNLAVQQGAEDLAQEARRVVDELNTKKEILLQESQDITSRIEYIRSQLPFVSARERTIDPEVLEQELRIRSGHMPGDEERVSTEQVLQKLEKEHATQAALEELKKKMQEMP